MSHIVQTYKLEGFEEYKVLASSTEGYGKVLQIVIKIDDKLNITSVIQVVSHRGIWKVQYDGQSLPDAIEVYNDLTNHMVPVSAQEQLQLRGNKTTS